MNPPEIEIREFHTVADALPAAQSLIACAGLYGADLATALKFIRAYLDERAASGEFGDDALLADALDRIERGEEPALPTESSMVIVVDFVP